MQPNYQQTAMIPGVEIRPGMQAVPLTNPLTHQPFNLNVDPKWTPGTKLDIHFKWMQDVTGDGVPDVSCVPKIKAQQITVPPGIPPGQLMQLQNPNTKNMYSIQCPTNCGPGSVLEVEYLDSDGDGRYNYTGACRVLHAVPPPAPQVVYQQAPPQPVYAQPPPGQPVFAQPPPGQPMYAQPPPGQPMYAQPPPGQPVYAQPPPGQPVYAQPPPGQPMYGQPPPGQPMYGQPQPVYR